MHRVLWSPRQDKPPLNNAISLYTNPHAMENYINNGIELYYIFDLENGTVIMSDSELGDMTFTLSAYDPENMTFTITDGTSEGIYTIYSINNSQLEFYSFFDFSQEYIRPHCERVE